MALIKGILKNASGVRPHTRIILEAAKTTSSVVVFAPDKTIVTDANGNYSFECNPSTYKVTIMQQGMQRENVGVIRVYSDSIDSSLNDFLTNLKEDDLTPEIIKELELLRNQAEESADRAEAAADNAADEFSQQFQDRFNTLAPIPWTPNTLVNENQSLQVFEHDGLFYLPNVKLLPFTTGAGFNADNWVLSELVTNSSLNKNAHFVITTPSDITKYTNDAFLTNDTVVLPVGTHSLASTIAVPANKTLTTLGSTTLGANGNFGCVTLADSSVVSNLTLIGSGKDAGLPYQYGVYVNRDAYHSKTLNMKFKNLSAQAYTGASTVGYHAGNTIDQYEINSCNVGLDIAERMEFVRAGVGSITQCNTGLMLTGGNFNGSGGMVICDNNVGMHFKKGSNDAHGILNGATINHNAKCMIYEATNGFDFDGCVAYYGDIDLIGCHDVNWRGGSIQNSMIIEDGAYNCLFDTNFIGGLTNTPNANGHPSQVIYQGKLPANVGTINSFPVSTVSHEQVNHVQVAGSSNWKPLKLDSVPSQYLRGNITYSFTNHYLAAQGIYKLFPAVNPLATLRADVSGMFTFGSFSTYADAASAVCEVRLASLYDTDKVQSFVPFSRTVVEIGGSFFIVFSIVNGQCSISTGGAQLQIYNPVTLTLYKNNLNAGTFSKIDICDF